METLPIPIPLPPTTQQEPQPQPQFQPLPQLEPQQQMPQQPEQQLLQLEQSQPQEQPPQVNGEQKIEKNSSEDLTKTEDLIVSQTQAQGVEIIAQDNHDSSNIPLNGLDEASLLFSLKDMMMKRRETESNQSSPTLSHKEFPITKKPSFVGQQEVQVVIKETKENSTQKEKGKKKANEVNSNTKKNSASIEKTSQKKVGKETNSKSNATKKNGSGNQGQRQTRSQDKIKETESSSSSKKNGTKISKKKAADVEVLENAAILSSLRSLSHSMERDEEGSEEEQSKKRKKPNSSKKESKKERKKQKGLEDDFRSIPYLKEIVETYLTNPNIQAKCFEGFIELSFEKEKLEEMASCSIYTNVKNALIRYPKHQPLIENGCAVLANLAVLKSCRPILLKEGFDQLIVEIIKLNQNHAGIIEKSFTFLRNLHLLEGAATSFLKNGHHLLILNLMKAHLPNSNFQLKACSVFYFIAQNIENSTELLTEGVASQLALAIRAHPFSSQLHFFCCSALKNLAEKTDNLKIFLEDEDVYKSIIYAIHLNQKELTILESGRNFFLALGKDNEIKEKLERERIIQF